MFVLNYWLRGFLLSAFANRLRCDAKQLMLLYYKICPFCIVLKLQSTLQTCLISKFSNQGPRILKIDGTAPTVHHLIDHFRTNTFKQFLFLALGIHKCSCCIQIPRKDRTGSVCQVLRVNSKTLNNKFEIKNISRSLIFQCS